MCVHCTCIYLYVYILIYMYIKYVQCATCVYTVHYNNIIHVHVYTCTFGTYYTCTVYSTLYIHVHTVCTCTCTWTHKWTHTYTHIHTHTHTYTHTHSQDSRVLESLLSLTGSESLDGFSLTLVYRRDGIVNLDFINLVCEWPDTAEHFKRAVNELTYNMLHAHASPVVFYRKKWGIFYGL